MPNKGVPISVAVTVEIARQQLYTSFHKSPKLFNPKLFLAKLFDQLTVKNLNVLAPI